MAPYTGTYYINGSWNQGSYYKYYSLSVYEDIDTAIPADTTAPTVTTFTPADEASSVAVNSDIVVTFNEAIARGTGNIVLKTSAGATVATYDAATSSNLSISGNTLILNPTADLAGGSGYKVEFAAGTIKDLAGNSYAGTASYNFTTAAPSDTIAPTVTTFTPADEAIGVAVNSDIVVTFNEAIARGTGNIVLKTSAGATVATYDAATSSNLSISGNTLILNPTADLAGGSGYKVEFAAGTIKDLAGNSYAGTASYNFTTQSNQNILGSSGNDILIGGTGNDTLDGGAGVDTAVFSGIKAGYTLIRTSSGMTAVSASDGTDALINIERLHFTDKTIAFDLDGNAGQAYRLYQAAFDRVPDQGGLGYWINEMDRGMGLSQVATGFINSAEFKALYGNNPSNSEFVTLIYDNVLHRTPDAGGYSYWMEQLSSGMTKENVLIGFSESTENKVALMAFSMDGNMGKDYRLYQAAFDRKPDVSGLDYWYHQLNSGMALEQVASGFINSAEFKALYGNNSSNAELVTLLYDNVLHRAPDTGGFNFWMNDLDHGTSREEVLIGFSESIENQFSLVGIVQTGIEFV